MVRGYVRFSETVMKFKLVLGLLKPVGHKKYQIMGQT